MKKLLALSLLIVLSSTLSGCIIDHGHHRGGHHHSHHR
ncbi:hypothetical protein P3T83_08880 [Pseudocitrobacter sp. 2023EL-00150]|nr:MULTISPECIES: hypothetical protein [unclassified Pseudocitrobacter]MDF3827833.1 hypothetical protein [Pseudocitrobacter sp. 2023EL-00150]